MRLLLTLLLCSCLLLAAARASQAQPIAPLGHGPYPVLSSCLEHETAAVDAALTAHGSLASYWQGAGLGGEDIRYVTDLLTSGYQSVTLDVPNDPSFYGAAAGTEVEVVYLIHAPTTAENPDPDYTVDGVTLPHMHCSGTDPIFPDLAERYPVVVVSHGLGGSPMACAGTLCDEALLAEHGYVVVVPFHGDLRFPLPGFDLSEYQIFALRPLAVRAVLDDLAADPLYGPHVDMQNVAGVGASFGGGTLLAAMGGQVIGPGLGDLRPTATDGRLRGAACVAPYLGDLLLPLFGIANTGAAEVALPFLAVSGSDDTIAPITRTQAVLEEKNGGVYLASLAGAGHDYAVPGSTDLVTYTLTFLEGILGGNPGAMDQLSEGASVSGDWPDQLLLATPSPLPLAPDVTGWWWDASQPGTGVSIERQDDRLYIALYDADPATGAPIWASGLLDGASPTSLSFSGTLKRYVNGPALGSATTPTATNRAASVTTTATATLTFDSANMATLVYDFGDFGEGEQTLDLTPYLDTVSDGVHDRRDIHGWWWNPDQAGCGLFLEAQGETLYLAVYHYRADGTPTWWVMGGFLDPNGFTQGVETYTATLMAVDPQTDGGLAEQATGSLAFNTDGSLTLTIGTTATDYQPFDFRFADF